MGKYEPQLPSDIITSSFYRFAYAQMVLGMMIIATMIEIAEELQRRGGSVDGWLDWLKGSD